MRTLLALLPDERDQQAFVEVAQAFTPICDGYLLSASSHPHVTLTSFPSGYDVEAIWAAVQNWTVKSCQIRMLGLLLKKGQIPPQHYSVGITIARDTPLLALHHQAVALLAEHGIAPLNPHRELYLPHLTLAGICWQPSLPITLSPIIDTLLSRPLAPFRVALGHGDDIGQYLTTLSL
jgi:2'-5' RNA ligase